MGLKPITDLIHATDVPRIKEDVGNQRENNTLNKEANSTYVPLAEIKNTIGEERREHENARVIKG